MGERILAKGAKHTVVIVKGEKVKREKIIGDGKKTLDLTEEQEAAFADKLVPLETDEEEEEVVEEKKDETPSKPAAPANKPSGN